MLTYTKVEARTYPRLEIAYDLLAESPRRLNENLGYFITAEGKYESPDENDVLIDIVKQASDATCVEEHMENIKSLLKDINETVLYITPIVRYEHGDITYSRGVKNGFDYSNCGFYIITDKTCEDFDTIKKEIDVYIDIVLKAYNTYANGEIYTFNLYDEDGELYETASDIYSLEEIINNMSEEDALEWKDEDLTDYLI